MAVRVSDEDVWHWYEIIEKFHAQHLPPKRFCDVNNYDYKIFNNRYMRIVYKSKSDPELYKKLVPIGRKYLDGDLPPSKFVKIHDITLNILGPLATHLNYLDVIERIKREKAEEPMKFISVSPATPRPPIYQQPEPELIEKQNDLEIVISKGVKVSISPNIDSMKIIKIIELLKDL